ncbi:MAG: YceD family protein, partial [Mycobacteriales bacterium]
IAAAVRGECSRCLEEITDEIVVEICELYAYPDSTTDQTADADEVSRVQDERIDSEPAIRDAVLLAIPVIPLCREDCPGLCAGCGEHRDSLPADHAHDQGDIRWAALSDLGKRLANGTPAGDTAPN